MLIEDLEIRKELTTAAWGQSQIKDCATLFVFCSYKEVSPTVIADYVNLVAETRDIPLEQLSGYADFISQKTSQMSHERMQNWLARQCYIALGTLLAACAEAAIDSCPMEGFSPDEFDRILGLTEQGLTASVIAAVGYKAPNESFSKLAKVRKSNADLFVKI